MLTTMNDQQRKLASDNHNLIYSFLNKYGLNSDDYYDIAAIGFCKACINYDDSKGHALSTYAYYIMLNEVRMSKRSEKKFASLQTVRLDDYVSDDVRYPISDIVPSPYHNTESEALMNCRLSNFLSTLSDRELYLYNNLDINQQELSRELGISQSYVSRLIRDLKLKFELIY
jgi:RNA polymerase sigma factor (sigma-70 family)